MTWQVLLTFYKENSAKSQRKAKAGLRALGLGLQARARAQQQEGLAEEKAADEKAGLVEAGEKADLAEEID